MTIGAKSNRDELVKTLRGMQFSKLNLGFLKGEDLDGKQREGYDKYGKFQIRFGWGIGAILTGLAAYAMYYAFFPRRAYYYDDPDFVWIRENFYWLLPIWAVPAYFLWKANRKVEDKESSFLSKAVAKNGLVVLPSGTRFPGDLVTNVNSLLMNQYTTVGTTFESAFALKYDDQIRVAFGLSSLWWDASSGVATNRGLMPSESLFVYVAVPELTNDFIYVNPSQPPTWSELPAMSEKAREALTTLAKRYAVVIGGGGIGVGLAKDSINGMQTSLRGDMKSPSGWNACYGLLSTEVADIVEGIV
jgi:hypothetical protein